MFHYHYLFIQAIDEKKAFECDIRFQIKKELL